MVNICNRNSMVVSKSAALILSQSSQKGGGGGGASSLSIPVPNTCFLLFTDLFRSGWSALVLWGANRYQPKFSLSQSRPPLQVSHVHHKKVLGHPRSLERSPPSSLRHGLIPSVKYYDLEFDGHTTRNLDVYEFNTSN